MRAARFGSWLTMSVALAFAGCATDDPQEQASCGDGVCSGTETATSCPADCTTSTCGNHVCDPGETAASCPADCTTTTCGNHVCDSGETAASCPGDCATATCGNQVCDGSESCSTCSADCGQCPPDLSFTWDYPIVVGDGNGGAFFPAYVAHLLGGATEAFPWEFHTACVTATNTGTVSHSITVETQLVGYSTAASTSASIPASSSKRVCADPVPNLTALYALSSNTPSSIASNVKDNSNQMTLTSTSTSVTILSGSDIVWQSVQFPMSTLRDLAVVFAMPHHPVVESTLTGVVGRSVYGAQLTGHANAYDRPALSNQSSIAVGQHVDEQSFFYQNESIAWSLPSVSGGSDNDIDVYAFTAAQYNAWVAGTGTAATAVWANQVSGAMATFTAPTAGWYVIVLFNTTDNFVSRQLTFQRTATAEFVVRDVLLSTFSEMRAQGITYVSVTPTFFQGSQHIKRVDQIAQTHAANCIDGTVYFASVAELIGMKPEIILKTGHAYMGLQDRFGGVWAIETTLVGDSSSSPWDAYVYGINELITDSQNDPAFHEIDISAERQLGLLPMPQ